MRRRTSPLLPVGDHWLRSIDSSVRRAGNRALMTRSSRVTANGLLSVARADGLVGPLRQGCLPLRGSELSPGNDACVALPGLGRHVEADSLTTRGDRVQTRAVRAERGGREGVRGKPERRTDRSWVSTSHSTTVPSAAAVTSVRPSGVNAGKVMRPVCAPWSGWPTAFQLFVENRRPVPSYCPTKSSRPSGEKATEREKSPSPERSLADALDQLARARVAHLGAAFPRRSRDQLAVRAVRSRLAALCAGKPVSARRGRSHTRSGCGSPEIVSADVAASTAASTRRRVRRRVPGRRPPSPRAPRPEPAFARSRG